MFGAGYAVAEDRLFFIDALRAAGRAELSTLRGWRKRRHGRVRMGGHAVQRGRPAKAVRPGSTTIYGAPGQADPTRRHTTTSPASTSTSTRLAPILSEDAGRVRPDRQDQLPPAPIRSRSPTCSRSASLVAGIFGKGGGGELELRRWCSRPLRRSFGAKQGQKAWADFRSSERSGGADDRARQALPVEKDAQEPQGASQCRTRVPFRFIRRTS